MTFKQLATIDELEAIAHRDGATLSCDEYDRGADGALVVSMIQSIEWDREQTFWTLRVDGSLEIW